MSDWLEQMVNSAFKRVNNGYLFQPGFGWRLGRSPCYLVNDAQKAVISARLRRNMQAMPAAKAVYIVAALAVFALLLFAHLELFSALITAVAVTGVPFVIAGYVYGRRTLGPLLEGLPVVEQRISLSERFEQQSKVLSWKLYLLLGLGCVYFAILFATDTDWPLAAILFVLMAAYCFWLVFLGWNAVRPRGRW